MPEYPSEPPHCKASIRAEAGTASRRAAFASGSIARIASTPPSTARRVPPISWMVKVRNNSLSAML